jgi:hypothetical protein
MIHVHFNTARKSFTKIQQRNAANETLALQTGNHRSYDLTEQSGFNETHHAHVITVSVCLKNLIPTFTMPQVLIF